MTLLTIVLGKDKTNGEKMQMKKFLGKIRTPAPLDSKSLTQGI
jgi:hypothetical protein